MQKNYVFLEKAITFTTFSTKTPAEFIHVFHVQRFFPLKCIALNIVDELCAQ